MSTIGMNHFILEKDEPGFYWHLVNLIETFADLEEQQGYVLGTLHGITYTLLNVFQTEDSIEYQIGAKQEDTEDKYVAVSYINPDEIYMEDGNLHVIETWNGLPGVFEAICFQHDFDAKPEFYFLMTNEWDEDGVSNDKEEKYFKGFGRLTTLEDHWIGK